jgi:hypothetical protein
MNLKDFEGMTPVEAWAKQTQLVQDYEETLYGQLYLTKLADNYKRVGNMKLEQYKIMYKKYTAQLKNFNIKDMGNKARKIFSKMKFLMR